MIKKIIEDYDYKELYGDYEEDNTEDNKEDIISDYLVIEDGILKECTNKDVVNVDIPNSVKEINNGTFGYCTSLQSITIPNSVTKIGGFAFWNCESLKSITIPDSVKGIGIGAFNNCPNLTIRCNTGSYIEQYAFDNYIKVEYI